MGTFTINIEGKQNKPPDLSGTNNLPEATDGAMITLTSADFTTAQGISVNDSDGDALKAIKITDIASGNGFTLKFNGNIVNVNDILLLSDIDNGTLEIGGCTQCTMSVDYHISDFGSDTFSYDKATIVYNSNPG